MAIIVKKSKKCEQILHQLNIQLKDITILSNLYVDRENNSRRGEIRGPGVTRVGMHNEDVRLEANPDFSRCALLLNAQIS